jgi:biotin carboxyl carrier protein
MRYAVVWGERQVDVEVCRDQAGVLTCLIDGRPVTCTITSTHPNDVGVQIGAAQFWAQIDGDTVWMGAQRLRAEVLDLRTLALRRAQEAQVGPDGPVPMAASMPGRIAAVLVEEGQEVEAGTPLVVVEAMKMENELRAPKSGRVTDLRARVGSSVELGATLCFVT